MHIRRSPLVTIERGFRPNTREKSTPRPEHITLTLSGSRAPDGMDLVALQSFLGHFTRALRGLDRHERGVEIGKPGQPEAEANAATALRVVSISSGSAVIALEPLRSDGDDRLPLDDPARSRIVCERMMDGIRTGTGLPGDVVDALAKARRACGDDGVFEIAASDRSARVDTAAIDRMASGESSEPENVVLIAGRLRKLAADPDQAVIDGSDGTEWRANFPQELEETMRPLWLKAVRAEGEGRLTGPARGTFAITAIAAAAEQLQSAFYSPQHRPLSELLAEQGIGGPQGLETLVNDEPISEADEDAFFAAVLGDD